MPGSRLPDEGSGSTARKIAEMLRSDERCNASLTRVSALTRAKGLGPRVLERIVLSSPRVANDTLVVCSQGACGEPGVAFKDLTAALVSDKLDLVWRAAMMASWAQFVDEAVGRSGLAPSKVWATSWAIAETAHWVAGRHILEPDEMFTAGLCLDAGLVAMVYALPEVYAALAASGKEPVEDFEARSFGFDHSLVGLAALRQFKFSEDVAEEAHVHTRPLLSLDMTGKVLRAAQIAVCQAGGDFGFKPRPEALDRAVLDAAMLRAEHESELRLVAERAFARASGSHRTAA